MKLFKFGLLACALWWVVGFAGCSSPEVRIQRNPALFARLTLAQQEMIKKGQVDVGFDQEMVKLALGEPDRIVARTDARGTTEIWSYQIYDSDQGMLLYRGYYHRYYAWGDPFYPFYLNFSERRMREQLKVGFDAAGKVGSIEQQKH